jgi:HEAT repeat protein
MNRSVPHWMESLHHPSKARRRAAADALGARGHEAAEAVPALTEVALTDRAWRVRLAAVVALRHIGRAAHTAVPSLLGLMVDLSRTLKAAQAGPTPGPDDPTPARPLARELAAGLARQIEVCSAARQCLEQMGLGALPGLVAALADPEPGVRSQVAYCLLEFGAWALPARPALRRALHDPVEQVRQDAAMVLFMMALFDAPGGLKVRDHSRRDVPPPRDGAPPRRQSMRSWTELLPYAEARARRRPNFAAAAVRGMDPAAALPVLVQAAQSVEPWQLRHAAVATLGEMGGVADAVVPALLELLRRIDRTLRAGVRPGWRAQACPRSWDDLAAAEEAADARDLVRLNHKVQQCIIAGTAWTSLARLGAAAVPPLEAALAGRAAEVRFLAALGLLKVGPPARTALPALRVAAADADASVRAAAALALRELDAAGVGSNGEASGAGGGGEPTDRAL